LENFRLPGDVAASKRYWKEDVINPPVEVSADGRITQSDAPGIGYDVKEELLEKLTVRTEAFSA
jgi:O-succinylbenzoate synthase